MYLCAIRDVFSNRLVGYSIDARMKSRLAVTALDNAVARRAQADGCILHSDHGSQFRSRKFVRALDRRNWTTREELRIAIVTWIERTCQRRRKAALALGRLTPVEFETVMAPPALQAA
ncbi:transposase InsO family protein [Streptomyces tendae]